MSGETQKQSKAVENKDYKAATNIVYRKAIIKAIEELQDCQLRSNMDAISRHVQASFGPEHVWNDKVFLMTVKALAHDGAIEQCAGVNCGFSPDFKRKRTGSITSSIQQVQTKARSSCYSYEYNLPSSSSLQQVQHALSYSCPADRMSLLQSSSSSTQHHEDPKQSPKRKQEHVKLKIIPKKIYDKQFIRIRHPMDTR